MRFRRQLRKVKILSLIVFIIILLIVNYCYKNRSKINNQLDHDLNVRIFCIILTTHEGLYDKV